MSRSDWLPSREQDLADLAARWQVILGDPAKVKAYGWVQVEVTTVLDSIDAFLTARTAHEADNSTAKRIVKDEARGEMVDAMRDFANASIRFNKKMTDADREALGIHAKDGVMTTHPAPTAQPDTVVDTTANHFEHKIRALNRGRSDTSKPDGVHGVRYGWQVGGEKPLRGEDLPKSQFSRKTSLVISHSEADKGQTVYYATCYENAKGDQGPWSPVEEAIIG
jgi:hypothetical protein